MLRCNYLISFLITMALLLGLSQSLYADVLELGESQLHGKKDQPEAMTFISRAPLDEGGRVFKINGKEKIKSEVKNNKLFDLQHL